MEDILKDIQDARNDSVEKYGTFLTKAENDEKVALGDQWIEGDKEKQSDKGEPALNLNIVGKGCRMVSAQQRQNPMDIVYYPVEGTDQEHADVYTKVSKWLFTNGQYKMFRNLAFDDSTRTGIGWLLPEMNYDLDPVYGDIKLRHESIYTVYPDPHFTDMTLEDCDYIIRHKYIAKQKAKGIYTGHAEAIEKMSAKSDGVIKPMITSENKVYVTEYWYRNYETVTILIDPLTGQGINIEGQDLDYIKFRYPQVRIIERQVAVIKLQTSINDTLLVYNDDVPEGLSRTKYPFIPIFGFFTPHYNETHWDQKLQGYARALIDSQREKNKTRSILMSGMMRNFSRNRLFYETGALVNADDFMANREKPVEVADGAISGKKIYESPPMPIDAAMVQLEQMHTNDIKDMGINPDLLQVEGGSAASAPTSSLQLRREQGLMSVQELFDNLGFANRMLGLYNIDLINMWPRQKLENILGQSLPQDWDDTKGNARYDCVVDEKISSPTYRQSISMQLQGWVQHGVDVPPQILRAAADLPADIRKQWDQIDKANAEAQSEMQKMQTKLQEQMITIQMQTEQLKQQGETMRLQIEERGKDRRLIEELTNKLAIAKISKKVKNG